MEQLTASRAATAEYVNSQVGSYPPEPSSSGMGLLNDIVGIARTVAGGIGGVPLEASGSFAELIQAQIQSQMEMQTTSMVSNIERSKHESKMTPIRNIRLG